jgi:hypothetical protein
LTATRRVRYDSILYEKLTPEMGYLRQHVLLLSVPIHSFWLSDFSKQFSENPLIGTWVGFLFVKRN